MHFYNFKGRVISWYPKWDKQVIVDEEYGNKVYVPFGDWRDIKNGEHRRTQYWEDRDMEQFKFIVSFNTLKELDIAL
jgi:hypothetical protein